MKPFEVKLSLPVVAPLLDVIRDLVAALKSTLAADQPFQHVEPELKEPWIAELIQSQQADLKVLMSLFDEEFFAEGIVTFDENNAETVVRACASIRLKLREQHLKGLGDEALESGDIDLAELADALRTAYLCYLFLATMQELIIRRMDPSEVE